MEFNRVVRQRRMVRDFRDEPIAPDVVDGLIDLARRAPAAGNTWGTHFVVLDRPDQTARYWDTTLPPERRKDFPWPGLLRAPVVILPCGDETAYVDRYSEDDKARTGLGESAEVWSIPYWHVDTAMASMTLLHAAVDVGLGALFFGVFHHEAAIVQVFDIPASVRPIGAIALGYPAGENRPSESARRGLAPLDKIIHRGGW